MAKKKGKKRGGNRGGGKKKGSLINTSKLLGIAGGLFGEKQINKLDFVTKQDPKLIAAGKILLGEYAQDNDTIKGFVKDDSARRGAGDALIVKGVEGLMAEFGIAGIGKPNARKIKDTDDLAVVTEDVLGDDDELGEDDLNTVNEDVLGDDDELGDDDMSGDDDLGTVNEDVLGDDDDTIH
jgi:hypothetical protein